MQTKVLIISVLLVTYCLGLPGYNTHSVWERLVYMFAHDNLFHLACNAWCVWLYFGMDSKRALKMLPVVWLVAALATFGDKTEVMTTGFSGCVCAMNGINLGRKMDIIGAVVFAGIIYIPSLITDGINNHVHMCSLIYGFLIALVGSIYQRFRQYIQ